LLNVDGLVAWYQFKETTLEYELRYHDHISSFSKMISVHPKKRWSLSWLDLRKRERIKPVMPFRTSHEKKEKQAPSYETLILKTEKGWMTERKAILNHVGGVVSFRIFSSLSS
jgi:ribosomal protein S8